MENLIEYDNFMAKSFMMGIKLLGIILLDILVVFLVAYFFDVENFFTNGGLNYLKSSSIMIRFIIIILAWIILLIFNYRKARKLNIFNVRFNINKTMFIFLPLAILLPIIFTYKVNLNNFHFTIIDKYDFFLNKSSGNEIIAYLNTILQYLYWLIEMLIVILIIDSFNTFGNHLKFVNFIPWGGLGLFFTWGLEQILMRPNTYLSIFLMSLIGGLLYKLSKRNFFVVFVYFLVFILIKG